MNNQKQFHNFRYNTKCNIWRVSFANTTKEYVLKDYYSNDYNIVIYNNSETYKGICINQLNMFYGELCTMYYVWKNNLKSDIVGFDQYGKQWKNINYNEINKGKTQVYIYWNIDKPVAKGERPYDVGCFLYSIISYIKFYYPEYSDKIDYLLYHYPEIKNHVNIFICKWDIFVKICDVIFGYFEHILPNEQWQNKDKIKEYINFNVNYHKCLNLIKCPTITIEDNRHIIFCLEIIFGTIHNIISESFDYNTFEYYVVYECNNINDYNNILKLYKYNLGNGIRYVLIKDNKNIFKNNFNDPYYTYKYMFLYDKPYLINDTCQDIFGIGKNGYLEDVKQHWNEICLNTNEYVYSVSSIELNKGNYTIKTI